MSVPPLLCDSQKLVSPKQLKQSEVEQLCQMFPSVVEDTEQCFTRNHCRTWWPDVTGFPDRNFQLTLPAALEMLALRRWDFGQEVRFNEAKSHFKVLGVVGCSSGWICTSRVIEILLVSLDGSTYAARGQGSQTRCLFPWFGAAARNLEPGSARFRKVPHAGSILKSWGFTRFHIKVSRLKVEVPQGSRRFHIKVPFLKVEVPQGST